MEIVKKCRKFFVEHLKCPNFELYDEEFHQVLQIFYLFGLYQPIPSKQRTALGIVMFAFISTCCLGALRHAFIAIRYGSITKGFFNAAVFLNALTHQVQVFSFFWNQKYICQMFRGFHSMHERDHYEIMSVYRSKYFWLVKYYKILLAASEVYLILLKISGDKNFILILPAIYDGMAEEFAYSFFLMVNIVHMSWLILHFIACDSLHILIMMRVEAHLEIFGKMLQNCTADEDPKKNEESLIACVKYHCRIIS